MRRAALARLKRLSAVDRIVLGEKFDLDFESWLLPAMHEIVRRHQSISVAEAQLMGLDTTLKLAFVREHVPSGSWEPIVKRRPNVEKHDFSQVLRDTFLESSG